MFEMMMDDLKKKISKQKQKGFDVWSMGSTHHLEFCTVPYDNESVKQSNTGVPFKKRAQNHLCV